jgi:hypothetical protein
MAVDVKRVLREKPGSFMTWFLPLLVISEDNVELLDLLELFGLDKLSEAIERLGGSRIVFPTWETVDALVRDAYLVARMDALAGRAALEEEFGVPYEMLQFRARAVRGVIRRAGALRRTPGGYVADKWINGVKKTNEEIAQAVQEANKNVDDDYRGGS